MFDGVQHPDPFVQSGTDLFRHGNQVAGNTFEDREVLARDQQMVHGGCFCGGDPFSEFRYSIRPFDTSEAFLGFLLFFRLLLVEYGDHELVMKAVC